ncbi:hypothetical protein DSO57_1036507 [Entomophthora muscae]|uniref:Uncharacterized protein n=1 Tax=Entomophthora muscae TaxID=34485 RepID=A0ACC2U8W4_9FUNG|nr:hypothetical protein DSO57_1036507 [Entomophthora muscae]
MPLLSISSINTSFFLGQRRIPDSAYSFTLSLTIPPSAGPFRLYRSTSGSAQTTTVRLSASGPALLPCKYPATGKSPLPCQRNAPGPGALSGLIEGAGCPTTRPSPDQDHPSQGLSWGYSARSPTQTSAVSRQIKIWPSFRDPAGKGVPTPWLYPGTKLTPWLGVAGSYPLRDFHRPIVSLHDLPHLSPGVIPTPIPSGR